MAPRDENEPSQMEVLTNAFREQLLAWRSVPKAARGCFPVASFWARRKRTLGRRLRGCANWRWACRIF
jgi:hypothetical protein